MRYPQPDNEDQFEEFCLLLLRRHWSCPTLERYGHRGERQDGIDLLDLGGGSPLRAAQCKHHTHDRTLPPAELKAEVEKVKKFTFKVEHYSVLTTAKKSTQAQLEVARLNRVHREQGLFPIELLTWEGIERLLDDYPEVREAFEKLPAAAWQGHLQRVERNIHTLAVDLQSVAATVSGPSSDVIERDLDEAKAQLQLHNYQLVRLLLARRRDQHWDHMSARQRFRLLANTANALLGEGELKAAAKSLLEARSHQPNDDQAAAFEALAYELLADRNKAYDLSGEVLKRSPTMSKAAAVRARSAPSSKSLVELEAELPQPAINAEVAVALALRAIHDGLFDRAREYASRATAELPKWATVWLVSGKAALASEAPKFRRDSRQMGSTVDFQRLKEADAHFAHAIELARESGETPVLVDALTSRAQTRELLGTDGDADVEEAYRLAPSDPEVLVQYAGLLQQRTDVAGSISCLRRAVAGGANGVPQLLLAGSLSRISDPSAKEEALTMFRQLAAHTGEPYQDDAAAFALRMLCERAAWDDCERFLSELAPRSDPNLSTILLGSLAQARGNATEAKSAADLAFSAVDERSPASQMRLLAGLLAAMGDYPRAFELLERLYIPGFYTQDAHNLIACAERLGRHDLVLRVCRSLREAGAGTASLFEQEVGLLERYDPPAAISLLRERLSVDSTDKYARLRLSVIGVRIGDHSLIASDPAQLPDAIEAPPELVPAVVHVLDVAGRSEDAVNFAYRALRRHFERPETHSAFLHVMLPTNRAPLEIAEPTVVVPGTAVIYTERGSSQQTTVVIENGPEWYAPLGEIRPDSSLAQRLIGKKIGDAVVIANGVQPRIATINQILDKRVYRFQYSLQNWQLRFGDDQPFVQMMRMEETASGPNLQPILRMLDARQKRTEEALSQYDTNPMPVHVLAEALSQDDVSMTLALASDRRHQIRCRIGADGEVDQALEGLRAGVRLVIDTTAIATVMLLELEHMLTAAPFQVSMTYSVADELKRMSETNASPAILGMMRKVPGGYELKELTPDERQHGRDEVVRRVDAVRAACRLAGAPSLAAMPPDRRDEATQLFGVAGAESVANASSPGNVLWTDDVTLALVAQQRFGVRVVWTEIVLRHAVEQGFLAQQAYDAACAKLIGWGYSPTPVNPQILFAAGLLADWNPNRFPLEAVLDTFGKDEIAAAPVVAILSQSTIMAFNEVDLPQVRAAFLTAVLGRVAKRKDGSKIVAAIHKGLRILFGLNALRSAEADEVIAAWLSHRRTVL